MLVAVLSDDLSNLIAPTLQHPLLFYLPYSSRSTIGERTADEMRTQREKLEETGDHVSNCWQSPPYLWTLPLFRVSVC